MTDRKKLAALLNDFGLSEVEPDDDGPGEMAFSDGAIRIDGELYFAIEIDGARFVFDDAGEFRCVERMED